ncbi:MAG: hypothetical protein U1F60_05175 [Planctomycetota bacterium]
MLVDGKVIASRERGGLGGGWPQPEQVIARIEALQKQGSKPGG